MSDTIRVTAALRINSSSGRVRGQSRDIDYHIRNNVHPSIHDQWKRAGSGERTITTTLCILGTAPVDVFYWTDRDDAPLALARCVSVEPLPASAPIWSLLALGEGSAAFRSLCVCARINSWVLLPLAAREAYVCGLENRSSGAHPRLQGCRVSTCTLLPAILLSRSGSEDYTFEVASRPP